MGKEKDHIKMMNMLTLAFVGDAVQELYIKSRLAMETDATSHILQDMSVRYLCCEAQAEVARKITDKLDEEELAIYTRARNTRTPTVPKHATVADYHAATAIEAVLGYKYLMGDEKRVGELLDMMKGLSDDKRRGANAKG